MDADETNVLDSPATGRSNADSGFVGRRQETEELRSAFDKVLAGTGRMFFLTGEPGIGKTRLAEELAHYAAARDARVAWGRWIEEGGAPPFWAWVQIIRSLLPEVARERLLAALGSSANDLARLVPELWERLNKPDDSADKPDPFSLGGLLSNVPDAAHFRLFDAISRFLKTVAAERPLVIILDDAHAADADSLLFLRSFAGDLRRARVMLILTHREIEVKLAARVGQLMGEIGRDAQIISLHGLSEGDVRDLVELRSGQKVNPDTVASLHHATEGNPFFLTEVLRLLIAEGRVDQAAAGIGRFEIPNGIRVAIHRRLQFLSEAAQRTLTLASVMGREFSVTVLSRLARSSHRQVTQRLHEASKWGLIAEAGGAIGRYRFSHDLVTGTLYQELPTSQRQQLHRRVAEILEGLCERPEELEARLAELAHHCIEALPLGPADKAVEYAARAAAQARESLAYAQAAELYELALRALDTSQPLDRKKRCVLLLELGEAQYRAEEFAKSKEAFRQAASIARDLRDAESLGRAMLGVGMKRSDWGVVDQALVAMLEEALAAVSSADSSLRVMLMARLAFELYWSNDRERRTSIARQAVEIARRLDDRYVLMQALYAEYVSGWGPDARLESRLDAASELVKLAHDFRFRGSEWLLRAWYLRIANLLELGDIRTLDAEMQTYAQLADELRLPRFSYAPVAMAMRALMEGRFDAAEKLAQTAFERGLRDAVARQMFVSQIFMVRREQGNLGEMESVFEKTIARIPALTFARCALALCYSERGARAEAKAEFERLASDGFADVPRDPVWLASIAVLAEVCVFVRDASGADALYEMLLPYASRNASIGLNLCFGAVAQYLGMLAAAMSHFAAAESHFEAALAMNRRMGARPWVARTQYEYGLMLATRGEGGDVEQALDRTREALDIATALGMKALEQKACASCENLEETLAKLRPQGRTVEVAPRESSAARNINHGQIRRVLATVLLVDIVGSTKRAAEMGDRRWMELLRRYFTLVRQELSIFRGREIDTAGDGFLATFDAPVEAIDCVSSIQEKGAQPRAAAKSRRSYRRA
jgi:eukaryotic-like serine/threonine-protein kinase